MEDKVDLLFAPWDTAFLFAAAPIVTKHKMVLMGGSGGAVKLKKVITSIPYYFQVLNSLTINTGPCPGLQGSWREDRLYRLYPGPPRPGVQRSRSNGASESRRQDLAAKSFPLTSRTSRLLKEAKASGADAFLAFLYPQNAFPATGQAMEVGYNPKAFYMTVDLSRRVP